MFFLFQTAWPIKQTNRQTNKWTEGHKTRTQANYDEKYSDTQLSILLL